MRAILGINSLDETKFNTVVCGAMPMHIIMHNLYAKLESTEILEISRFY